MRNSTYRRAAFISRENQMVQTLFEESSPGPTVILFTDLHKELISDLDGDEALKQELTEMETGMARPLCACFKANSAAKIPHHGRCVH